MSRRARRMAHAAATGGQLVTFDAAADSGDLAADVAERTITGMVVPFGVAGGTSDGLMTFSPGSITWHGDVGRVKLLRAHDQDAPLGRAVELAETDAGIVGTFSVAAGPEGDALLAQVGDGRRDGLSVGVFLDAATEARLRRAAAGQVVAAAGRLREVSAVTVPAFDDARATVGRQLAAASAGPRLTRFTGGNGGGDNPAAPADPADPTLPPAQPDQPNYPPPLDPNAPQPPQPGTTPAQPTQASAPAVLRAAAGAALTVSSTPSTYRFDGNPQRPSMVRDVYLANFGGGEDRSGAAARLDTYNRELRDGNAQSIGAFLRAAGDLATFADIPSPAERADVGVPGYLPANNLRPDLMLRAVDAGRPIASRLNRIPITSPQPFALPIEGEFEGVGLHTEGTPHVAPGTLSISDSIIQPRAMSGAYVVSRELADSTNPALDSMAARAMLRDYRRESEGVIVAALAASDAVADLSVNTAIELRAALAAFVNDDDEPADFVAVSRQMIEALYAEVDADGRPMIAGPGSTAPTAVTSRGAGYTGVGVDGTELVRASRVPANEGFMIRKDGVVFVESAVQQFTFTEILGPGQIKLALWAYVGAGVARPEDVARITTGAA